MVCTKSLSKEMGVHPKTLEYRCKIHGIPCRKFITKEQALMIQKLPERPVLEIEKEIILKYTTTAENSIPELSNYFKITQFRVTHVINKYFLKLKKDMEFEIFPSKMNEN